MPQQVNKKENSENLSGKSPCPMDAAGWNFTLQTIGEDTIASICANGQALILIDNIGTAYQTLKPLNGDFGVISRFMHDGERWLKNQGQPGVGMNVGHSIWLEWKQKTLENNVTPDEFFEAYLGQELALSPSVM